MKPGENRIHYHQLTRNHLEEKLILELAGMAAETLFYDEYDVSSIGHEKYHKVSHICAELNSTIVLNRSNALEQSIAKEFMGQHLSTSSIPIIPKLKRTTTLTNNEQRKINEGFQKARLILSKNFLPLCIILGRLLDKKRVLGIEVREILCNT
jgi:hypothetical protein